MKKWTIEDSKELYNINGWGVSYFGINEQGNVFVSPCKNDTRIDLQEVMHELALRDVTTPVLLRFPDGNGRTPFYERGREFALGVNYRF